MYSILRSGLVLALVFAAGCTAPKPKRVLTISEQLVFDTVKAQGLFSDYQKRVVFLNFPEGDRYLNAVAAKISKLPDGLPNEKVVVRVHRDEQKNLTHFYSFPGTTISIPLSFLKSVDYENELAAVIAFELANVMNRHLAKKMEKTESRELFGPSGLFVLDRSERLESIQLGTHLLYYSGYDLRGLASVFQRYAEYFSNANDGSDSSQKEVDFNVREAQRAKSAFLPSLQPIVRSADFITMKKGLKRL